MARASLGLLLVAVTAGFFACGRDPSAAIEPVAPEPVDGGLPPSGGAPSPWQGLPGPRLEPLTAASSARTQRFMTSDECAVCHAASASSSALRDAKGRDVSPFSSWRGSMMGLAARDPYYLAILEHELSAHPGAESTVMSTCTRCHAPAANVELQAAGAALSFSDLTHGASNEAVVGRDGVTCSLCHQIQPTNLGTAASFTGGYVIDESRTIFGPHESPFTMPMRQMVDYTTVASAHTRESGLCGSCHTVVTHSLDAKGAEAGPAVLEQGPFVEWSVSSFAKAGGKSCQDCHMPTTDDDGAAIATVLSLRPAGNRLSPRSPFSRHTFVGANGLMLRVLANERAWAGFDAPAELLFAEANRADASLRTAARVVVAATERSGAELVVRIRVDNLTGHKLPTAYPSRRMWLHFRVLDEAGAVVFESGAHRSGRIVDGAGLILDGKDAVLPHRNEIAQRSEVQVWEAIMRDAEGKAAGNLLDATGYLKDDRVLPDGFDRNDARAVLALPVGAESDADFVPASDTVTYRVATPPARGTIEAVLLYQTIRPAELEQLAVRPGPAALRFLDMIGSNAMEPVAIASVALPIP